MSFEISQLRTFSPDEVNACEQGACCQCGVCCTTFRVIVPSVPGKVDSPTMVKQSGEICPQLSTDVRGNAIGLRHDQKNHPSLRACRNWSGEKIADRDKTYFSHLCSGTGGWLTSPEPTPEATARIAEALSKNMIPSNAIERARAATARNPMQVARSYLYTRTFPVAIINLLELPQRLRELRRSAKSLAIELGLREGDALYREFLANCCPWDEDRKAVGKTPPVLCATDEIQSSPQSAR